MAPRSRSPSAIAPATTAGLHALLAFFSTRAQLERIRPFFRTREDWRWFRQRTFNEARRRQSYNALTGNSSTARQLVDMQDAGQLGTIAEAGRSVANGGLVSAAFTVIQRGIRRLSGLTPRTADHMARLLASRDPQTVAGIVQMMREIDAGRMTRKQKLAPSGSWSPDS